MNQTSGKNKFKFFIFLLLTAIMMFSFTTAGITSNAVSTKTTLNKKDTDISVTGFVGTTKDGRYVVDDILAINFRNPANKQFNKFSINYTASDVMRGTITFQTITNVDLTEEFYLEKGEKLDFASLLNERTEHNGEKLINIIGLKILQLTFEPIRANTKVAFKLNSVFCEMSYRPINDTVYIENDHFKVGIFMSWGGGINYIEDKKDGDDTLENILNFHDTGRLVQQSYYGTSKEPYECGFYNNTKWGYNPVQGGDQYNHKSKLVDFKIEADRIYVKCRPLDWAKNGVFTYVYMENVYSLKENYIEVDNRYIDFSTYDHGEAGRHQELPAFYTISYFDTFSFYGGTKPWTDDAITTKNDLPFWGDPKLQKNCYFQIDKANTETWCAWNSSETGYGIGLYTPQIELFLAGRFRYDGSKHPRSESTNYVAPLITTNMKNFTPFEYSYIVATGDVNSIRETFKAHKDEFNWREKNEQVNPNPEKIDSDYTPSSEFNRVAQLDYTAVTDEPAPEQTPAAENGTTKEDSSNFYIIVIGICIGSAVIIAVVVFIIIRLQNKRKNKE